VFSVHRHPFRQAWLAVPLLLGGCGTNVNWILAEESRIVAEADPLLQAAEEQGTGLEQPVYAAEDAKAEACAFLHAAAADRMRRDPGFGEQFVSDLSAVVALLLPIRSVERCADSLKSYVRAVEALSDVLGESAAAPATIAGRDRSAAAKR
jgi:hypothetical protein